MLCKAGFHCPPEPTKCLPTPLLLLLLLPPLPLLSIRWISCSTWQWTGKRDNFHIALDSFTRQEVRGKWQILFIHVVQQITQVTDGRLQQRFNPCLCLIIIIIHVSETLILIVNVVFIWYIFTFLSLLSSFC